MVCNLASLSLGNLAVEDEAYMERTVETAIRALDNVIDLNFYPLEYARLTNQKYRSIGLGVSGYHHMLAKRGIRWESDEHLAFTDAVFEHINYAAVKADTALAREKGRYALFEGQRLADRRVFLKSEVIPQKSGGRLRETVAVQGNAQRLSAGCRTHFQHIHPLRHVGGHRSNYEEILFRGKRAACCPALLRSFLWIHGGTIRRRI